MMKVKESGSNIISVQCQFGKMLSENCHFNELDFSLLDIHFHQFNSTLYQKRMIKKVPYGLSRTFQHKLRQKCMV